MMNIDGTSKCFLMPSISAVQITQQYANDIVLYKRNVSALSNALTVFLSPIYKYYF